MEIEPYQKKDQKKITNVTCMLKEYNKTNILSSNRNKKGNNEWYVQLIKSLSNKLL